MEVWNKQDYVYLHFVMAEVLIGNSTPGERGLILPPPVRNNPLVLYDSLIGGSNISVIFSGYQALPMYIITCKEWPSSELYSGFSMLDDVHRN